jgi:hypothetical protein
MVQIYFNKKYSIEYMYIWCEYKNHYIIDDTIKKIHIVVC